jgi:putative DNA primase/helicase
MADHIGFRLAMQAAGLVPPKALLDDGRIHRCGVDGKKPSNKSGAYRLTPDGEFGGMQNWADGSEWREWRAAKPSQLTPEQRCSFLAAQRAAADKERAERRAARDKAKWMWSQAKEGQHPYLDRKGICSNGSRVLGDLLLVPMLDWDGQIHSIQTITTEGEKRFLKGGKLGGCFHWVRIGQQTGPILYVCEGFATAATVHAATGGKPAVVAFCASNLLPVGRVLRENLPRVAIIFCADNDAKTPGNPGVTAATAAALAVHGRIVVPLVDGGTDFNDVANTLGTAEAKMQIATSQKPIKTVDEKEDRDYPRDSPPRGMSPLL